MNELHFKILNSCSGKTYKTLVENYGKKDVDFLVNSNYIVILKNDIVTRTEDGVNISKPIDVRENIFKSKKDFHPINDSGINYNETDKPLFS